ncbi:hypothetical protein HGO34_15915 [Agrobacterium vitis]|uniref:hypothetical protein n=1 Tax=Agrobacterium vitis TaxID=373 RepID=UPI001F2AF2AB|nr:hypothetical protein [Agrobacterium vitis]MCF1498889.1 hypothetical protein [Allorhizobium sp. Av2]MCM2441209.1 hypothetical protein [Agrobacterium vitis]
MKKEISKQEAFTQLQKAEKELFGHALPQRSMTNEELVIYYAHCWQELWGVSKALGVGMMDAEVAAPGKQAAKDIAKATTLEERAAPLLRKLGRA